MVVQGTHKSLLRSAVLSRIGSDRESAPSWALLAVEPSARNSDRAHTCPSSHRLTLEEFLEVLGEAGVPPVCSSSCLHDRSHQAEDAFERDLNAAKSAFGTLMQKDLPAFNASMAGKLAVITDKPPDPKKVEALLPQ